MSNSDHQDRAHARISGSKMARIMACPGSVALSRFCPEPKESKWAKDGTITHELIEEAMALGMDAEDLCDEPDRAARAQQAIDYLRGLEGLGLKVQIEAKLEGRITPERTQRRRSLK